VTTVTIPAITEETIMAALQRVVEENPGKVYAAPKHMDPEGLGSCFYVHNNEDGTLTGAGCIVGTVLHQLGIPLKDLRVGEGLSANGLFGLLKLETSPEFRIRIRRVQMGQDRGDTWAVAYRAEFGELA
jgi:hypothetical protein